MHGQYIPENLGRKWMSKTCPDSVNKLGMCRCAYLVCQESSWKALDTGIAVESAFIFEAHLL